MLIVNFCLPSPGFQLTRKLFQPNFNKEFPGFQCFIGGSELNNVWLMRGPSWPALWNAVDPNRCISKRKRDEGGWEERLSSLFLLLNSHQHQSHLKINEFFFFFFFLDAPLDLQDLKFRNQESNPLTLQWKHRMLTTGLPGKSPNEQKFYVHFRSVCFSVTTEWIGHLAEVCNTKQVSWLYLFWSTVKLSILSKGKQPH